MLFAYLEAMVEVARLGTVRGASHVLHVGQPALSARIAALEAEVGVRLFERLPKGMRLTPAGLAFLPHAERALEGVQAGVAHARDVQGRGEGEIVLGAAPAVSAYVLPELIARLRRVRPALRMLVRTGHSEEIVSLVVAGEVQVGLIRDLGDARVVAQPLYEEELLLVVRPDHPFAYDGSVSVERLRETVLIMFDRTSRYYEITHSLFRGAGVVPSGTIEVDNIETAKRMTVRGLGVAFLPSTAVADALEDGTLVSVSVIEVAKVHWRIVAIERPGKAAPIPAEVRALLTGIPGFIPGAMPIGVAL